MKLRRIRYLDTFVAKDVVYAFFRRWGNRTPLRTPVGSPEFWEDYHAAAKGEPPPPRTPAGKRGTLQEAIDRYLGDSAFVARCQSEATRSRQASTLKKWRQVDGHRVLAQLDKKYVLTMLDAIALPNPRRTFLITIREFLQWSEQQQLIASDPTAGIVVKLPKTEGHHTWTEEEIAQFLARWPLGTIEHLLFALLLYTGQRCSDVIRLGRQHIRDGKHVVKQRKTGVEVRVPVAPALAAAIDACPNEHLTYLTTAQGKPFVQRDLNKLFRTACNTAGLPKRCVPHGLRKAFCRRLADLGVPPQDIAALSGHLSLRMVLHYTAAYDRGTAGERTMAKLVASGQA